MELVCMTVIAVKHTSSPSSGLRSSDPSMTAKLYKFYGCVCLHVAMTGSSKSRVAKRLRATEILAAYHESLIVQSRSFTISTFAFTTLEESVAYASILAK